MNKQIAEAQRLLALAHARGSGNLGRAEVGECEYHCPAHELCDKRLLEQPMESCYATLTVFIEQEVQLEQLKGASLLGNTLDINYEQVKKEVPNE